VITARNSSSQIVSFRSNSWRVELRSWIEIAVQDLRRAILAMPGFFVSASDK
jgi:hypothetical protein